MTRDHLNAAITGTFLFLCGAVLLLNMVPESWILPERPKDAYEAGLRARMRDAESRQAMIIRVTDE